MDHISRRYRRHFSTPASRWLSPALAALLIATAGRLAPLTDGPPDPNPGALEAPPAEPAAASPTLRLFTPFLETGRLTPNDVTALSQLPLPQALRTLAGALGPQQDCDEPPFSHDCMEPLDLTVPPEPDSLDVRHYNIEILELDESAKTFRARTAVLLTALKPLNAVDLDLAKVTVTEVVTILQGTNVPVPAAFTHRDSVLHVVLDPPMAFDESRLVRVVYQGSKGGCTDSRGLQGGIVFTTEGVHAFSEPAYARYWYPCHDVIWDKADFRITVTVPPGRKASACGVLQDSTRVNGQDVMTWATTKAIPPYLASFYVNDYVMLRDMSPGGVPLEYFVYPQLVDKARRDFVNLPDMVDYFSGLFGPYPNPRYAMSLNAFGGGMEHDANSLIGSNLIRGNGAYESLFAHELGHQWWGNWATPKTWSDVWLKEGFATYCELLYTEHRYGFAERKTAVALIDTVYKGFLADPDSPVKDHPIAEPSHCKIFSWVVYQKGARFLDMLRGQLRLWLVNRSLRNELAGPDPLPADEFDARAQPGDELFFSVLYRVRQSGSFLGVTTARFVRDFLPFFGTIDFLDPWLYGLAYPTYTLDWIRERHDGLSSGMRVRVVQEERPGVPDYEMYAHIRYRSGSRARDEVRLIGPGVTEWTVNLPAGAWEMEFDPDDWMLETHRRVPYFTRFTPGHPYPNPSSSGFTFSGELEGTVPADVTIAVYDLQGRQVWETDLGTRNPDTITATWDGTRNDGRRVPAGVYFARVQAGSQRFLQRLVVLP